MKKLTESFKSTGIRNFRVEVEHSFPWVSIHLGRLNCEEMVSVSDWIKVTFYESERFAHLSPTLGLRNGSFCLVIDIKQCEKIFGKMR